MLCTDRFWRYKEESCNTISLLRKLSKTRCWVSFWLWYSSLSLILELTFKIWPLTFHILETCYYFFKSLHCLWCFGSMHWKLTLLFESCNCQDKRCTVYLWVHYSIDLLVTVSFLKDKEVQACNLLIESKCFRRHAVLTILLCSWMFNCLASIIHI